MIRCPLGSQPQLITRAGDDHMGWKVGGPPPTPPQVLLTCSFLLLSKKGGCALTRKTACRTPPHWSRLRRVSFVSNRYMPAAHKYTVKYLLMLRSEIAGEHGALDKAGSRQAGRLTDRLTPAYRHPSFIFMGRHYCWHSSSPIATTAQKCMPPYACTLTHQ